MYFSIVPSIYRIRRFHLRLVFALASVWGQIKGNASCRMRMPRVHWYLRGSKSCRMLCLSMWKAELEPVLLTRAQGCIPGYSALPLTPPRTPLLHHYIYIYIYISGRLATATGGEPANWRARLLPTAAAAGCWGHQCCKTVHMNA